MSLVCGIVVVEARSSLRAQRILSPASASKTRISRVESVQHDEDAVSPQWQPNAHPFLLLFQQRSFCWFGLLDDLSRLWRETTSTTRQTHTSLVEALYLPILQRPFTKPHGNKFLCNRSVMRHSKTFETCSWANLALSFLAPIILS